MYKHIYIHICTYTYTYTGDVFHTCAVLSERNGLRVRVSFAALAHSQWRLTALSSVLASFSFFSIWPFPTSKPMDLSDPNFSWRDQLLSRRDARDACGTHAF